MSWDKKIEADTGEKACEPPDLNDFLILDILLLSYTVAFILILLMLRRDSGFSSISQSLASILLYS